MHQLMPSYLPARRKTRVLAGAAVIALALGALAATPGTATASSNPACGSTLTTDTVLTADLSCPTSSLIIGTSGITLDLGGHTLSGSFSSIGVVDTALVPALSGVTIRNGTISGFGTGILLEETENTTISHVQLINDGLSGDRQGAIVTDVRSSGIHVDHSTISTSGRAIWTQNADITVDHTTVSGGAGILLADGEMTLEHDTITGTPISTTEAGGVTITHCMLNNSPIEAGFEAFVFTNISHNHITDAAVAISLEYPSIDATISDNVFRNDRIGVQSVAPVAAISTTKITGNRFVDDGVAGILLDTPGTSKNPLMISGNRFVHDGFTPLFPNDSAGNPVQDGLHINASPGSDIVISDNRTRDNASYGIRAIPGTVVDGGGNTSVGNPNGCLGVTCS